jgi:hypothetical protein
MPDPSARSYTPPAASHRAAASSAGTLTHSNRVGAALSPCCRCRPFLSTPRYSPTHRAPDPDERNKRRGAGGESATRGSGIRGRRPLRGGAGGAARRPVPQQAEAVREPRRGLLLRRLLPQRNREEGRGGCSGRPTGGRRTPSEQGGCMQICRGYFVNNRIAINYRDPIWGLYIKARGHFVNNRIEITNHDPK